MANVLAGADEFRLAPPASSSEYQSDRSIDSRNPLCGRCFGPALQRCSPQLTSAASTKTPLGLKEAAAFSLPSAQPSTSWHHPATGGFLDVNATASTGLQRARCAAVNSETAARRSPQPTSDVSKDFVFRGDFGIGSSPRCSTSRRDNPSAFDRFGEPHVFAGDPGQGEQRLWQFGARVHF